MSEMCEKVSKVNYQQLSLNFSRFLCKDVRLKGWPPRHQTGQSIAKNIPHSVAGTGGRWHGLCVYDAEALCSRVVGFLCRVLEF